MTNEDKLRFETVGGFNLLSNDDEIKILEKFSETLNNKKFPSCNREDIKKHLKILKEMSGTAENFIQVVSDLDTGTFEDLIMKIVAIAVLNDKEMIPFANNFLRAIREKDIENLSELLNNLELN